MRPLLIHESSKASIDSARRSLHTLFVSGKLPEGLR